jgi:ATP-dependent helicase/nuclease subunit A
MEQNIILCKASAGSGKTFMLVKEFLKSALIAPYSYKNILAITFTNKATAEMKERILDTLKVLSISNSSPMYEVLVNELPAHINIQKQAQIVLKNILHDYQHFSVMTIDSFFLQLLRSFARELSLPPSMNVMLNLDVVIKQCIESLYDDYGKNDFASRWMRAFVEDKMAQEKKWKINNEIKKLAQELFKEINIDNINSLDEAIHDKIIQHCNATIQSFRNHLKELAQKIKDLIAAEGFESDVTSAYKSFLKKIFTENLVDVNASMSKILNEEQNIYPQKASANTKVALQNLWDTQLKKLTLQIIDYDDKERLLFNSANLVKENFHSYILLYALIEKIQNYRKEEEAILISDLNNFIASLIHSDAVTFIYEKVGLRYNTILMDEFQDTSTLQWNNVLPLLLELLAQDNGKILIVGDAKQSIYRWRGGNLQLILKNVKKDLKPFSNLQLKESILDTNWRSLPKIVAFNNFVFGQNTTQLGLTEEIKNVFEDATQKAASKANDQGWVTMQYYEKPDRKHSVEDKQRIAQDELQQILNYISIAIEDGYNYADIAILVKKNKVGIEIATFLRQNNIDIVSSEVLEFLSHPIIDMLLEACRHILDPNDDLTYLKCVKKIAHILKITQPLDVLLENKDKIEKILHRNALEEGLNMPLENLFYFILKKIGYTDAIDDFLVQFIDLVKQYNLKSIEELLLFMEEEGIKKSAQINNPNAVQILTIHKSKGLEFPIVIVPKIDWSFVDYSTDFKPKYLWLKTDISPYNDLNLFPLEFKAIMEKSIYSEAYNKEFEAQHIDIMNLLYVAFTRAVDRLHILLPKTKGEGEIKSANKLISSILKPDSFDSIDNEILQFGGRTPKNTRDKGHEILQNFPIVVNIPTDNNAFALRGNELITKEKNLGNVVHHLLYNFEKLYDNQSVTNILNDLNIPLDEHIFFIEKTKKILNQEQIASWYKEGIVCAEKEIIYKGKIIRPDVFIVFSDKIIVLDYKTGVYENSNKVQLLEYKAVIGQVFNLPVQAYLVYIREDIELLKIDSNDSN